MTRPISRRQLPSAADLADERGKRRRRIRAWIARAAGLFLLALLVMVRDVVSARVRRPDRPFSRQVRLEPVELAGPWWKRHRSWLTTPTPFTGTRYLAVNLRTGTAYSWRFRGNRRGRGWFGVRTRWVWVHPAWKRDPWVLLYDHAEDAS